MDLQRADGHSRFKKQLNCLFNSIPVHLYELYGEFRIHQSSVQRKVFEGHDFQNIIYHLKHGNC